MTFTDPIHERTALAALEGVATGSRREAVGRALDAARELLDMDIAYFSEFSGGEQVIRAVRGDQDAVALTAGTTIPLEETFCRRMLSGQLANAVPDTAGDPVTRALPATAEAGIGSYIGVPLELSDGRVYGTFCCAASAPAERLGARDVQFMRLVARLLAAEVEREQRSTPPPATTEDGPALLRLDVWFAATAHAVATARSSLDVLNPFLEPSRLHDARLLVTELVSNSVRHAGIGPGGVVGLNARLCEERLGVAVSDPGAGFERPPEPPELDFEGGRGLFIVDRLAERWGIGEPPSDCGLEPGGATTVWFELECGPALATA